VPTGISSSDSILNLLQTISPGLSSLSTAIVSQQLRLHAQP
jgi:hypothetical protein